MIEEIIKSKSNSELPLSWMRSLKSNKIIRVNLSKGIVWLSSGKIGLTEDFGAIIPKNIFEKSIIIRGCNSFITNILVKQDYHYLQSGLEAVLCKDSNHFHKKSLRDLIKRGNRHGTIRVLSYSHETVERIEELKSKSTHANEPQLKHLFQSNHDQDTVAFIFEGYNKIDFGALVISFMNSKKAHVELLLRKENAPVGIMEALVFKCYNVLMNKGFTELSLGEVPFIKIDNPTILYYWVSCFSRLFAEVYNIDGLYSFKNKFSPAWENVFICYKNSNLINVIRLLSIKSNYLKLLVSKIFNK